jgi:probable rRNA maturation factor
MRGMNRDFRGRDQVTDVLSFPGDAVVEPGHLGDIVVCVPQARRQAGARGEAVEREIKTLLLHGVLHCMGHDHETDGGVMERLERRLRRRWLCDG